MKKKEVIEKIDNISDFLKGDIADIIVHLQDLKMEHYRKYKKLEIIEEYSNYDYNDECSYYLYGARLETDKEYDDRLSIETKKKLKKEFEKSKREDREKKELRKLMKKYPNEMINKEN